MKVLYIERKQFGKVYFFVFNLSIETGNFRNERFMKIFKRKINLLRFLFKNYVILINKVLSITIPVKRRFGVIIRFIMCFTKYDFKFNQRKYNIFQ